MMLDDRGVRALGKVSEQRKLAELARADVLCAPSLHGESFGMVLTEAFAAATPVLASDIPGYRDVVRDGLDGLLVPPGDALALAEALRRLALDRAAAARMAAAARERAERFAWPHVAAEVLDCYERGPSRSDPPRHGLGRAAVRHGLAPADLLPRIPAERLPEPRDRSRAGGPSAARCARCAVSRLAGELARRRRTRGARPAARRRRPRRRLAAGLQARPRGRRPRPDVRRHVRPRARLARDPRRRAHLAARQTPRRDAGHLHRRADVRDAARPPGRALARADRRPPPRTRARDAAGGARHDGLPDAPQPARARHPRRRHALERQRPRRPQRPAAAAGRRSRRSPRCCASLLAPGCSSRRPRSSALAAPAGAARPGAPLAAAPARRAARVSPAPPRPPWPPWPSSARGRCSGWPAGCC